MLTKIQKDLLNSELPVNITSINPNPKTTGYCPIHIHNHFSLHLVIKGSVRFFGIHKEPECMENKDCIILSPL